MPEVAMSARRSRSTMSGFLALLVVVLSASHQALAQTEPTTVKALQAQGKSAIGQEQLESLIVGNTLSHQKLKSTVAFEMWYRPDGQRVYWTGGPNIGRRFEGWYKIKDGQRCELSGGGGEVCFRLFPADEGRYFLCDQNDRCDWILGIEKGNPLGIE